MAGVRLPQQVRDLVVDVGHARERDAQRAGAVAEAAGRQQPVPGCPSGSRSPRSTRSSADAAWRSSASESGPSARAVQVATSSPGARDEPLLDAGQRLRQLRVVGGTRAVLPT